MTAASAAPLALVDAAALAAIFLFALLGLLQGFAAQLVRLLALAAGILLAGRFAAPLSARIGAEFEGLSPDVARVIAWAAILAVLLLLAALLLRCFRGAIRALRLQSYDRLAGALLGAAKGALWIALALIALSTLEPTPPWTAPLARSRSADFTERALLHVPAPEGLRQGYGAWLATHR